MTDTVRYVAEFPTELLGEKCRVEVSMDIMTGETDSVVLFKRTFGTGGSLSRKQLEGLLAALTAIQSAAPLLKELPDAATSHQLNWGSGAGRVIVVAPPGKPVRFVVSAGPYHREGTFDSLPLAELLGAVKKIDAIEGKLEGKAKLGKSEQVPVSLASRAQS